MKREIICLAVLAGGCGHLSPQQPLNEKQAMDLVWNQLSVRQFCSRIEQASGGAAHGFIMLDRATDHEFVFYVGEDHDNHTVVWNRFHVNRKTRAISLEEAER